MKYSSCLSAKLNVRNPFRVLRLPFLCRLYLSLTRPTYQTKWDWRVRRRIDALLFIILRRLQISTSGCLQIMMGEREREVLFNAHNFQFHSIYAPEYKIGYEPETSAVLDLLLRDGDVFYDIGSNWGHFSIFAASRNGFRGTIHAFEAHPKTYSDLDKIVQSLGIAQQVHCHECALSDKEGIAHIEFPDALHSGLARVNVKGMGTKVVLRTLDSLRLDPPSLCKLDVEGSESAVLIGANNTLRAHKPMVIFETWRNTKYPEEALKPFNYLMNLGYFFFQPIIRSSGGTSEVINGDASGTLLESDAELVLKPFDANERFSMAEHFNALACHQDRLHELEASFQTVSDAGNGSVRSRHTPR